MVPTKEKRPEKHVSPVLAIDIGGTKILAAIISQDGRMLAKERFPTMSDEGLQAVIDRIFASIDHLRSRKDIQPLQLQGIGIAAAGTIDLEKGIINESPNLPGWIDVPLRDTIQERYGINAFLVNDASAAALGEHRFGAGRGTRNMVLLTLGTGIGGGIIIDGELYIGTGGGAGELGHMTIDFNGVRCSCGTTGCLEELAAGRAVSREAIERINSGEKSSLVGMVGGKIEEITSETVAMAARSGDALALEVINLIAFHLGVGLGNIINIFNPEMIVLGGGMADMDELLLAPARKVACERAFPTLVQAVRIVKAELGNEAGVYGAAAFAFGQQAWSRN